MIKVTISSENPTCITVYIRSCPRTLTRPYSSVPPSHVRFLLPALPLLLIQHPTMILGLLYHHIQPQPPHPP